MIKYLLKIKKFNSFLLYPNYNETLIEQFDVKQLALSLDL